MDKNETAISEVFGNAQTVIREKQKPKKKRCIKSKRKSPIDFLSTNKNLVVPYSLAAQAIRDAVKLLALNKQARWEFEKLVNLIELRKKDESLIGIIAAAFAIGDTHGHSGDAWRRRYFGKIKKFVKRKCDLF